MARINTNVASLTAQVGLSKSQKSLTTSLQRLSTGLRINTGEDDPAGLIASEGLRSEISGINQAISNSTRANNVIATAEGALNEVASLLLNIKSLVVEAANSGAITAEEIAANQTQVNSAIESISRIANTSTFAGLNLLNGSLDYISSGVAASALTNLHINSANFGGNATIPVNISVVTSATQAKLKYATTASGITTATTVKITGPDGQAAVTIPASASSANIASAINSLTAQTGVMASTVTSGVQFSSNAYGSKAFVSVVVQSGTAMSTTDPAHGNAVTQRATGINAVASVNGALSSGDGRNIHVNSPGLNMDFTLDKAAAAGDSTTFSITGGGAKFQLGAKVNPAQQVSIGIGSVSASDLGNAEVGFLDSLTSTNSLANHPDKASAILEVAINQVATLRGRLGAFEKNTLDTNISSLQVALENVTSSESSIRDADFAAETSAMTRAQILTQAGTSILATANSLPQNVLSLLQH